MADIKITDKDPYEFYRVGEPLDVNDPSFKNSALVGADPTGGKDLPAMGHISAERLADVAKESEGDLSDRNKHQQEYLREVLEQRGIRTSSASGRKYFYSK